MASEPKQRVTVEQYLGVERKAETKSEYLDGEIFAMAGASRKHNRIVLNVAFVLDGQVKDRGCEVFASEMRVHVPATGLYTYPDVVVACGEPQFEDAEVDTLLNPILIAEVLSPSTESYDRGTKFGHYRTLSSLSEYVVIAQDSVHVEHWVRQRDGWLLTETERIEDSIELPSIGARLALRDVYDRVF
jgi:Uma2 family endonuclease